MLEPMGTTRRRPAVMADVAKLAGVSNQTVSRVTNGTGYVASATRLRVLAAMRELDYRPNSAARELVTGRSRALGVIARETTEFGPTAIHLGLERAARERGYLTITSTVPRVDPEAVFAAIDELQRRKVEGIVLHIGLQGASEIEDVGLTIPAVTLDDSETGAIQTVTVDQAAGATQATRLLLDLGHRTIAHIAGPDSSRLARERRDAWHATVAAAGMDAPEALVGDWSLHAGYELGGELAERHDVTAIFAANDAMAIGAMRALHLAGRSIPRDVSVIGYDDIPEARFL